MCGQRRYGLRDGSRCVEELIDECTPSTMRTRASGRERPIPARQAQATGDYWLASSAHRAMVFRRADCTCGGVSPRIRYPLQRGSSLDLALLEQFAP